MKKSLVTVLLVVLLIGGLFLLTGCGDNKSETKTAEKNDQAATVQTTDFYVQNLVPNTTIKELYAGPAGTNNWSPNLLGELEMATGTQAQIGIGMTEGSTTYDFKAVDEQGDTALFSSVDLSTIYSNKGGTVIFQVDENNSPIAVAK
ncbi:MAG: hypothetical protein J6I85_04075 [Clostridia bacterium]|nr:hypothetical protein [Clostridia bacterium]